MSLRGRLMALFPGLVLALAGLGAFGVARAPTPALAAGSALFALSALYLLPPLAYRLHDRLWPLSSGGSRLVGEGYSPWWGGHQIQLVYYAFPWLESALRLLPGAYSAWLRLWGSKVGSAVYWTPAVEIADRALMDIGDGVIFGHRAVVFGHVIKPRRGNLLLFVRRVSIGAGAFIGAGVVIAPGATIAPGAFVEAGSHVHPGERVGEGE